MSHVKFNVDFLPSVGFIYIKHYFFVRDWGRGGVYVQAARGWGPSPVPCCPAEPDDQVVRIRLCTAVAVNLNMVLRAHTSARSHPDQHRRARRRPAVLSVEPMRDAVPLADCVRVVRFLL